MVGLSERDPVRTGTGGCSAYQKGCARNPTYS